MTTDGHPGGSAAEGRGGGPRLAWAAAALVALQLLAVAPLITGARSLFLRDVLVTHLAMKQAEAKLVAAGEAPLVDPFRGGGQPHAGNPNTVALYPTALLGRVASPLWALNAHFWIHFLIAPWACAWLARELGIAPPAALAAGAVYAVSGFFQSQLSFYNLIAGAALTPALVAALLAARSRGGPWPAVAGVLAALLLLGGDPITAVQALALGTLALALGERARRRAGRTAASWGPLLLALIGGALLAAPQLVELARALPASYRGFQGFSAATRTMASFHPMQLLEVALPLFFGRVDLLAEGVFWGERWHQGQLPYFLSLAPGALALVAPFAAGRRGGRASAFAWWAVGGGLLVALGRHGPLLAPLWESPALAWFRYPARAWLAVTVGLALLAALAVERAWLAGASGPRRRAAAGLLALGGLAALVALGSGVGWLADLLPAGMSPQAPVAAWRAGAGAVAAGCLLLLLTLALARRRPGLALALLVAGHAVGQLVALAPLRAVERPAALLPAPPLLAALPAGTRVVHGAVGDRFGPSSLDDPPLPGREARFLARRAARELFPFVGIGHGLRYELFPSPEGLDGYLARLAGAAVEAHDDERRLRLLRAWGVDALLLPRPLAPAALAAVAPPRVSGVSGRPFYLYRLRDPVAPVRLVAAPTAADDPRQAVERLLDPAFDSHRQAVVAGRAVAGAGGRVAAWRESPVRVEATVETAGGGLLVVQRAWLPSWRATVDGRPAAVRVADLHRLAVEVPAGGREVLAWVDRRPFRLAVAVSLLGALLLAALGWRGRMRAA